jgi:succinate dehydrogenase / fumarate reductase cytochrome b subunit
MGWIGSLYRSSVGKKSIMAASGLLLSLFLLTHLLTGIILYLENLQARPSRYSVSTSEGGRSWGSRTMPYTGIIIIVFIIVHLLNFHFTDKSVPVADLVRGLLIVSLLAVALHLSHGAWSLFQSIGFNHDKYNGLLLKGALAFSILVGTVFILIPVLALVSRSFLL